MEFLVRLVGELAQAARQGPLQPGQQQVLQDALQVGGQAGGRECGVMGWRGVAWVVGKGTLVGAGGEGTPAEGEGAQCEPCVCGGSGVRLLPHSRLLGPDAALPPSEWSAEAPSNRLRRYPPPPLVSQAVAQKM